MLDIFGSNTSVYTLPGTWEPQPDIVYDPTFLMIGASVIIMTAGIVFLLSIRGKRKRV